VQVLFAAWPASPQRFKTPSTARDLSSTCFNSASAAEDEGKLHKADDEEGPIATISPARDFCVYFSNSASF
jgi:hypothetical protein